MVQAREDLSETSKSDKHFVILDKLKKAKWNRASQDNFCALTVAEKKRESLYCFLWTITTVVCLHTPHVVNKTGPRVCVVETDGPITA